MWVGTVNCFLPQYAVAVTGSSQLHIPDGHKHLVLSASIRYKSVPWTNHPKLDFPWQHLPVLPRPATEVKASIILHPLLHISRLHQPQILLSYVESDWLAILEFKVPNKASSILLDAVTTLNSQNITKHQHCQRHLPRLTACKAWACPKTLTAYSTEPIPDQA